MFTVINTASTDMISSVAVPHKDNITKSYEVLYIWDIHNIYTSTMVPTENC